MKQEITEAIVNQLVARPDGLPASAIRRGLKRKISQPTLWRHLDRLRQCGQVTVEGYGRATRYHAVGQQNRATLRSRRLHESVAARLRRDPRLIATARARLNLLRQVNPHGRVYHDRWQALLEGPLPAVLRMLTEDSEAADAMRKESPFTVLVTPAERRRVLESLRVV